MQADQKSGIVVRPLQISLLARSLIVFCVVFTAFFLAAYVWLYNYSATLIRQNMGSIPNLPDSLQPEHIITLTQAHIQSIALPGYIGCFAIVFLAVFSVSYRATRPLERMTQFALRVAAGNYEQPPPPRIRLLGRDEIDVLSDVFVAMVQRIDARETSLKQQVQQLQIEIDSTRQAEQVGEIAETDFFNNLKTRASEIRAKKAAPDAPPTEPSTASDRSPAP